jgi:hypothetical protein
LPSQLSYLWKEPKIPRNFRSAVSLHGHTNHSKEGLDFIWNVITRNPVLTAAMAGHQERARVRSGIRIDLGRAHWRPPLSPLAAYQLEREQIERALGLAAMISLSDHDNIEAPMLLRVLPETQDVPISVEWSLPYKSTTLHIGIHNLPAEHAEEMMMCFAEYTKNPAEGGLRDILQTVHNISDALIVLNHPMWDLAGIGKQKHIGVLHDFVGDYGMLIHAFELGGLRSWEENQEVLEFAERWDQIVIGGGDRHGAEPSAILNLTNAENFSEFVHEVRRKRRCHVLFMPQYSQPVTLRMLQSLLDAIREYPELPDGSRRWQERVFHPDRYGVPQPVGSLWSKTPGFIEIFFSVIRLLEAPPVRKTLLAALARPAHKMQFVPGRGREAAAQWTRAYAWPSFRTRTTKSTGWRTPAGNLKRSPDGASSLS